MSTVSATATRLPLAEARRRYGRSLLALAALGFVLLLLVLFLQTPPAARGVVGAPLLLLTAIFLGMGLVGQLWTWIVVWPEERRRLRSARPMGRLASLPASRNNIALALTIVIVAGLILGGVLWTQLSSIGLIGAPMLWLIVGVINLETARQVRRAERRENVIYYAAPTLPFFGRSHVFMLTTSPRSGS